jgi:hypothetical protein
VFSLETNINLKGNSNHSNPNGIRSHINNSIPESCAIRLRKLRINPAGLNVCRNQCCDRRMRPRRGRKSPVSFMAIKIGTRWVQEIVKQSRTDLNVCRNQCDDRRVRPDGVEKSSVSFLAINIGTRSVREIANQSGGIKCL